ncbi:MAG TPA: hypothetical protein VHX63_00650 [Acidobacteriaceae bacterium]|jgi:type II secretory pathway component GspD/PulD (secretin)|nr:hypothetical protein [Acidobacteriaceae bacterium]
MRAAEPQTTVSRWKRIATWLLCYALLCGVTEPLLLAQQAELPTAPVTSVSHTTEPLPAVSPKQLEKARSLFEKGTAALKKDESEKALALLAKAHRLAPANTEYLAEYEIAKQQRIAALMRSAEKQQNSGAHDAALGDLQQAQSLDPDSPFVREHIQAMSVQAPATLESKPLPPLGSGIIPLDAKTTEDTFHLRAKAQDLVHRVFDAYGITALLDESVPSTVVQFDIDKAPFAAASTAVQLATNTFVVPLDPHRVLVAKDTPENRKKFERLLLETVYLPGLSGKQMIDATNLIKNVFSVKQVAVDETNSTISIRAPESVLRAINLTVAHLYQEQPEVILDVRAYQVNYSNMQNLGLQLPQAFTVFNVTTEIQSLIQSNQSLINQLIASGLVSPGDYAAIAALLVYYGLASGSLLSQPFALFGNGLTLSGLTFGTVGANASLNISSSKQLDHVQLRGENDQTSTFLFGTRYPIITQSYSAGTTTTPTIPGLAGAAGLGGFAGLGTNSTTSGINALTTTPQVTYENLGLTLKATPQIQRDHHVRMQLQLKIEALAGSSLNGIPVLNSRAFVSDIEVRDGDSALIVSNMTREDQNVLSGIPGLSELPGMTWTGDKNTQVTVGDVVLVVTPHIINFSPRAVASMRISVPTGDTER